MSDEKPPKRQRSKYFEKYYAENRDAIAKRRRKKYQSDAEFRDKAKERADRQYWLKRRPGAQAARRAAQTTVTLETLKPVGHIGITVADKDDKRFGKEVVVPVYLTEAVSKLIGRSGQTVRIWERRGVLPQPAFRGRDLDRGLAPGANPRLYTKDELDAIQRAAQYLDLPYRDITKSQFAKAVAEEWTKLVFGLRRQV